LLVEILPPLLLAESVSLLGRHALERGQPDHAATLRYQAIDREALFNVVWSVVTDD
jgi:hypothetical protein